MAAERQDDQDDRGSGVRRGWGDNVRVPRYQVRDTLRQEGGRARERKRLMPAAENKDICRRFFDDVVSQGDLSLVDEICAPDYRIHATLSGLEAIDREALKELVASWRSSFPDGKITVEDIVAEGDLVAARMLERGTHSGDFKGISPTDKPVEYGSMTFLRVVDGRITDHWGLLDMPSVLEQIGSYALWRTSTRTLSW
jgi:predicted ester cyclase